MATRGVLPRSIGTGEMIKLTPGVTYQLTRPIHLKGERDCGLVSEGGLDDPRPIIDGNGRNIDVIRGVDATRNFVARGIHFRRARRALTLDCRRFARGKGARNIVFRDNIVERMSQTGDDSAMFLNNVMTYNAENNMVCHGGHGQRDHGLLYATASCQHGFIARNFVTNCRDLAQVRHTGAQVLENVGYGNDIGVDLYGGTNLDPWATNGIMFKLVRNLLLGMTTGIAVRANKHKPGTIVSENVLAHPNLDRKSVLYRVEPMSLDDPIPEFFRNFFDGFEARVEVNGSTLNLKTGEMEHVVIPLVPLIMIDLVMNLWNRGINIDNVRNLLLPDNHLAKIRNMLAGLTPPPVVVPPEPSLLQRVESNERRIGILESGFIDNADEWNSL